MPDLPEAIGRRLVEHLRQVAAAVSAAGLREYYDPLTGEGMGATDFSWSALVLEMLDPASPS